MTDGAHISDEVMERYALGTLDPEDRRDVDAHVALCHDCGEALRRELVIARGVRMAGREDLKRSLGRRVAALDRPRRRWRVMAAAASLALLVGSGLYVAWIEGRAPTEVIGILLEAGVSVCVYGHLHGADAAGAFEGEADGVLYRCVSADRIGFRPALLFETA